MTVDEIILSAKNVGMETLVSQADIKTEADIEELGEKGYRVFFTADTFQEAFPDVPAENIHYMPSISQSAIYFNKETLAAAPFHVEFYVLGMSEKEKQDFVVKFTKVIKEAENDAASCDFMRAVLALTDAMRLEYFEMLLKKAEKEGLEIPELYHLFFAVYFTSDFGFGRIASETVKAIVATRSEDEMNEIMEALADYPDEITVYRGGSTASAPVDKGYSWSVDPSVANFYACRMGRERGYLAKGTVRKDKVLACSMDTMDMELVVLPTDVTIEKTITTLGQEDLSEILPAIAPMYHEYLDRLVELDFYEESDVHGRKHEQRVLLLTLTIAHLIKLPMSDRRILAEAAIYHDAQRQHDGVDSDHGRYAMEYYEGDVYSPNPLVSFLLEYHCLPDEEGRKQIKENRKLSKSRSRANKLYDVFKDADALDRVRFGIKDLDISQLRLPVSKTLTAVARMYLQYVKLD